MNQYQEAIWLGAIRIAANLLMVGALFVAMYFASQSFGSSMLTFCLWFFGITVPVWFVAISLSKRIRRQRARDNQSMILLPNAKEPCLVEWKVCRKARAKQ
ncbi:MAG: hypothetical protein IJS50_00265 [Desulfovibrio sp.]|nr:hypothetical protein [Desulfovibrio sp.]